MYSLLLLFKICLPVTLCDSIEVCHFNVNVCIVHCFKLWTDMYDILFFSIDECIQNKCIDR